MLTAKKMPYLTSDLGEGSVVCPVCGAGKLSEKLREYYGEYHAKRCFLSAIALIYHCPNCGYATIYDTRSQPQAIVAQVPKRLRRFVRWSPIPCLVKRITRRYRPRSSSMPRVSLRELTDGAAKQMPWWPAGKSFIIVEDAAAEIHPVVRNGCLMWRRRDVTAPPERKTRDRLTAVRDRVYAVYPTYSSAVSPRHGEHKAMAHIQNARPKVRLLSSLDSV